MINVAQKRNREKDNQLKNFKKLCTLLLQSVLSAEPCLPDYYIESLETSDYATRSYADIINEIRKKSTETRPKVNRFAQQYSQPKTDQKGGHQGVRSRNHGTKGAGDPAVGNSGPKKLHHKVQRTSSHGKVQPRGVGKNHTSNSNKMRDFDKQIASSAPHLSKEEIEKQKMLKYEELRKDLARQEQQEKHQRDDMVRFSH